MTGEELDEDTIMSLFEAARWAPSSYNNQPWRFIYAKRNTLHWNKLFNLLAEPNKVWTKNAAVLVVVISRKNFEHNEKYSITHQYDAGAAWENLALVLQSSVGNTTTLMKSISNMHSYSTASPYIH